MDTRLAAHPNLHSSPQGLPVQRETLKDAGAPPADPIARLGVQTTGLDHGGLGAVNASRISSLQGAQQPLSGDRSQRAESPAQLAYRRQSSAVQPSATWPVVHPRS